jgi:hypothetical protein
LRVVFGWIFGLLRHVFDTSEMKTAEAECTIESEKFQLGLTVLGSLVVDWDGAKVYCSLFFMNVDVGNDVTNSDLGCVNCQNDRLAGLVVNVDKSRGICNGLLECPWLASNIHSIHREHLFLSAHLMDTRGESNFGSRCTLYHIIQENLEVVSYSLI